MAARAYACTIEVKFDDPRCQIVIDAAGKTKGLHGGDLAALSRAAPVFNILERRTEAKAKAGRAPPCTRTVPSLLTRVLEGLAFKSNPLAAKSNFPT